MFVRIHMTNTHIHTHTRTHTRECDETEPICFEERKYDQNNIPQPKTDYTGTRERQRTEKSRKTKKTSSECELDGYVNGVTGLQYISSHARGIFTFGGLLGRGALAWPRWLCPQSTAPGNAPCWPLCSAGYEEFTGWPPLFCCI